MNTQKGKEVYELMKMGAIDGLSVGYRVDAKGYHYDERGKRRMLKEVDLMEISAVTFPMNPKARISAVKAEDRSVRDWETFLRDGRRVVSFRIKSGGKRRFKGFRPARGWR